MSLGVRSNASASGSPTVTAADGDYIPFLADANGRLYVNVAGQYNSSGGILQDGSWQHLQVTSTGQLLVSADTELPAAVALSDAAGNPQTVSVGGLSHVFNGVTWDRLRGTIADGALVNLGANNDVTVTSGTITTVSSVTQNADVRQATASNLNAQTVGNAASAAADSGNPVKVGGKYDATLPTYTDGQRSNLQVDQRGKVYTTIANAGNSQTAASVLAIADAQANGTGLVTDSQAMVFNGATWDRARGDTTSGQYVGGAIAHDAVDSGNPNKIGAKATSSLSALTPVATADRTDLFAGVDGVQIVRPHCNLEDIISGVAEITDGSSTSVIAAQGSGIRSYVCAVTISNTSATAVEVDLRNGTAGAVIWTFPVPANTSGLTFGFPIPLPLPTTNVAIAADPSAAASTVTVSVLGFKSKV
jgi:hypothetical protein